MTIFNRQSSSKSATTQQTVSTSTGTGMLLPLAVTSIDSQKQQRRSSQNNNRSSIAKTSITMKQRNDHLFMLILTSIAIFSITYSPIYKRLLYSLDQYDKFHEEEGQQQQPLIQHNNNNHMSDDSIQTTTAAKEEETEASSTSTTTATSSLSLLPIISSESSYYPFTKVGNIHSTHVISKRKKLKRRKYSVTRYYHNNVNADSDTNNNSNNSNSNSTTTGTVITYENTIPESMMLLNNKLLWCPNAKAGTTFIYENIIFPMKFLSYSQQNEDPRCYEDCPISAWRKFDYSEHRRLQVMESPSFTIIRNPWDRLRSSYNNKIKTQVFIPTDDNPRGRRRYHEEEQQRIIELKSNPNIMTFVEYVYHVEKYPNSNIHWQPHSTKCMLSTSSSSSAQSSGEGGEGNNNGIFHYDHIIKLEDGNLFTQLQELFTMYGLRFPTTSTSTSTTTTTTKTKEEETEQQQQQQPGSKKLKKEKESYSSLFQFYNDAAMEAGSITLEELIKKVESIYTDDVRLHNYTFPYY